jgi:hypothetical protein
MNTRGRCNSILCTRHERKLLAHAMHAPSVWLKSRAKTLRSRSMRSICLAKAISPNSGRSKQMPTNSGLGADLILTWGSSYNSASIHHIAAMCIATTTSIIIHVHTRFERSIPIAGAQNRVCHQRRPCASDVRSSELQSLRPEPQRPSGDHK